MKYKSKIDDATEYECLGDIICIRRGGEAWSFPLDMLPGKSERLREPIRRELDAVAEVYEMMRKKKKKGIDLAAEAGKLLGISYGEVQTRRLKGELII
jgi:hypothetical protein